MSPSQDYVFGKETEMDGCTAFEWQKIQPLLCHIMHSTHINVSSKIIQSIRLEFCKTVPSDLESWSTFLKKHFPAAADAVIPALIVMFWPDVLNVLQFFMGHRALIH